MAMRAEERKLREELIGAEDFSTFRQNYLVEAGAGAGKTYTMVRRMANHLVSGGCEPENMVAITFTRKATEEMRGRLDDRLEELLAYAQKGQRDESGVTLTSGEQERRVARLEHLIRSAGRMQISTIHSFCQTMLETMPFASPLGPGAAFGEDEGGNARAFFARYLNKHPDAFALVQSRFGLSNETLAAFFAVRCANKGANIVARPAGGPEAAAWEASCRNEAKKLHRKLRRLLLPVLSHSDKACLDPSLSDALGMGEDAFAADDAALFALIRLVNQNTSAVPLRAFDDTGRHIRALCGVPAETLPADELAFARAHPLAGVLSSLDKCWRSTSKTVKDGEPAVGRLRTDSKLLLYVWLIHEMTPVLQAYREEKREKRQAFSDDQLMLARDMLRTSGEARRYFHGRYRAVYVDEFQDTDPIQTELLFYLTTDEDSFDPKDWRNCRPVPGSLFLVGDPKQSIYGFRGADISIYREVRALFDAPPGAAQGKIGRCAALNCSFRASQAVCCYNNRVFQPLFAAGAPGCQAQFAEMDVQGPGGPDAGVFFYSCQASGETMTEDERSAADARMLCAFIRNMVGRTDPAGAPYRYRDFLLLTPTTATVPFYTDALAAAGIPANITAKHTYGEFAPLQRLQLYLEWLLGRNAELTLLRLLKDGYRVELRTVHALMQRGGLRTVSAALARNENGEPVCRALAAALRQERSREPHGDKDLDKLLELCGALEELGAVQRMAREAPAMSVITYILQSCRGIWSEGEPLEHRRQCGWLLQFLALLRGYEQHSFPALAAFAIDSMQAEVSQELSLGAEDDCVRVMNLHQSKGLEARVVILTYSVRGFAVPNTLLVRSDGETKEYAALSYRKYAGAGYTTVAYPPEWEGVAAKQGRTPPFRAKETGRERSAAERVRLLYVAATRAAELLLINAEGGERSFWAPAINTGAMLEADAGQTVLRRYPEAFACLAPAEREEGEAASSPPPAAPSVINGFALEGEVAEGAKKLAGRSYFAVTPSGLDHGAHAPTRADRAAGEEDPSDSAPAAAETGPEEREPTPRGAHWGTIVHSVMEQAVRRADSSRPALEQYARMAASSVLGDGALSKREWEMVLGGREIDDLHGRIAYVAERAAEAAAFFSDPAAPLRTLMDGAECYPELPFTLCESDSDSALFRHLDRHFAGAELAGKRLELQGVIDLALWKDGGWTVVDYKTDCIRSGESRDTFCARLRQAYTAQIGTYAQVLERMRGKVRRAVLCAIAIGGELIELSVDGALAAGDGPGATGGRVYTTPLTELVNGRSFLPGLQSARGAHDFSLLRSGSPVALTDKNGARTDTVRTCAQFVRAVGEELCARYPGRPCRVDCSTGGSVVLLRRLLRAMQQSLPQEEWNKLVIRWVVK